MQKCEDNEQFNEKKKQLLNEREFFASHVKFLQAKTTQNQMSSQQEIESYHIS